VVGDAPVARVAMLEGLVEQYRVLLDTSAVISAETDIDQALAKITRLTTECMNVAWCDIYEVRPGNDQFVVVAFYQLPELDLDSSNWVGTVYGADTFADMQIAATELRPVTLYRDDPALTEAAAAELDVWGELSDLTVPMVYRGQLIGLIDVGESRGMRHFSDDDVRVLQAIADQAAIAIVNARTIKRLEEQAVTDDLTGLNNRRHLEERLRQEVAKARRYGQDLSVLMMDLDDFKRFNDTFGHTLGDKLLQELAAILSCETRQEVDVVARYGGDEFVVVMPLTPSGDEDVGAAIAAAERIRAAVGAHLFEGYPGRRDQHITISIGVAGSAGAADPAAPVGMDAAGDDASTTAHAAAVLLTAADKALYLAKRQGRDRVCLYDG
jgi:diguanylate cyclase (GGDEF)-like protein